MNDTFTFVSLKHIGTWAFEVRESGVLVFSKDFVAFEEQITLTRVQTEIFDA